MVETNSNKSYSMTIAGILISIAVVVIVVALTLGVYGLNVTSDKRDNLNEKDCSHISENIAIDISDAEYALKNKQGSDNIVSGSKRGCSIPTIETEKGSIDVNISLDPAYEMPLCFTAEDLADFNAALDITLTVCGGYEPKAYMSKLEVWQVQKFWEDPQIKKGQIYITWTKLPKQEGECCCKEIYVAEFTAICPDKICLVSSQLPTIPECMQLYDAAYCDNKELKLVMDIEWLGCWFGTIPTSDLHFPESPTPEL